jgi:hypothetical protein
MTAVMSFVLNIPGRSAARGQKSRGSRGAILLAALAVTLPPHAAWAASNTCKQCSEQRSVCAANYSVNICKTEYDRCLKSCRQK